MRPLRELGIPAAAIVDIDVLKEGGGSWANLLTASGVPSISHQSLASLRASVMQAFTSSGRDMKPDGGVERYCLNPSRRPHATCSAAWPNTALLWFLAGS
jgi:hypothetical protein